jgi:hypothetical protein
MGNSVCRGGVQNDEWFANGIEVEAIHALRPLLGQLDEPTLLVLSNQMQRVLANREPVAAVHARERQAQQRANGWVGRRNVWLLHWGLGYNKLFYLPIERGERDARLKLLIAEAAVHRYQLAHQASPGSLDELVPRFLPAVPTDPFGGRPLRYRRTPDGFLVYSVGEDEVDDGGVPPRDNLRSPGDLVPGERSSDNHTRTSP